MGAHPRPEDAVSVDYDDRDVREAAPPGALFAMPEAPLGKADLFRTLRKEMEDHLFRSRTLTLWRNDALKLYSRVGETEADFRKRCLQAAEDNADADDARLRDRYETRRQAARDRKAQAERRVRELETDIGTRRQQEVVASAVEIPLERSDVRVEEMLLFWG